MGEVADEEVEELVTRKRKKFSVAPSAVWTVLNAKFSVILCDHNVVAAPIAISGWLLSLFLASKIFLKLGCYRGTCPNKPGLLWELKRAERRERKGVLLQCSCYLLLPEALFMERLPGNYESYDFDSKKRHCLSHRGCESWSMLFLLIFHIFLTVHAHSVCSCELCLVSSLFIRVWHMHVVCIWYMYLSFHLHAWDEWLCILWYMQIVMAWDLHDLTME